MNPKSVVAIIMLSGIASAHHSFAAEYDINKPVRLDGIIAKFDFINPHAEIYLDVDGIRWWIEAPSPQVLLRCGISKTTLQPDMRLVIEGCQAKNGSHKATARAIVLSDGRKIVLDATAPE